MKIKENLALIAALAVPVLMIILVALAIYVPRSWAKPQYDFIYTTEYNYYYRFSVINGSLVIDQTPDPSVPSPEPISRPVKDPFETIVPKVFLHHTDTDTNEEITLDRAKALKLIGDQKSPDGFEVTRGDSGPLFFGGNNYNTFYLNGHHLSKKITLMSSNQYNDFHLIGWIQK